MEGMEDACDQQQTEQNAGAVAALHSRLAHKQAMRCLLDKERSGTIASLEPAPDKGHVVMPKLAAPSAAALQQHAYKMEHSSSVRSAAAGHAKSTASHLHASAQDKAATVHLLQSRAHQVQSMPGMAGAKVKGLKALDLSGIGSMREVLGEASASHTHAHLRVCHTVREAVPATSTSKDVLRKHVVRTPPLISTASTRRSLGEGGGGGDGARVNHAGPQARMTLLDSHRRLGIRMQIDSVEEAQRHGDNAGMTVTAASCNSQGGGRAAGGDARVPLVQWSAAQLLAEQRVQWKDSLPLVSGEGSRDEEVYARDEIVRSTTRAPSTQRRMDGKYAKESCAFLVSQRDEMELQRALAASAPASSSAMHAAYCQTYSDPTSPLGSKGARDMAAMGSSSLATESRRGASVQAAMTERERERDERRHLTATLTSLASREGAAGNTAQPVAAHVLTRARATAASNTKTYISKTGNPAARPSRLLDPKKQFQLLVSSRAAASAATAAQKARGSLAPDASQGIAQDATDVLQGSPGGPIAAASALGRSTVQVVAAEKADPATLSKRFAAWGAAGIRPRYVWAVASAAMSRGGSHRQNGDSGEQGDAEAGREGHMSSGTLRDATRHVMKRDIHRAYLQGAAGWGAGGEGDMSVTYDEMKMWAQGVVVNLSDIQVEGMWREAMDAVAQAPFQAHITSSFHTPAGDRLSLDRMSALTEALVLQEWGSWAAAKVAVALEYGLSGCSLHYRLRTLRALFSSGDGGRCEEARDGCGGDSKCDVHAAAGHAQPGGASMKGVDVTRARKGQAHNSEGTPEVYPCAHPPPPVHLTLIEPSHQLQSPNASTSSRLPADSPRKLAARRAQLLKRTSELAAEKIGLEEELIGAKRTLETSGMLQRELRVELERVVRQKDACDRMVLEQSRAAGAEQQTMVRLRLLRVSFFFACCCLARLFSCSIM